MAKIKLTDLPKDQKISKKEMKKVLGGAVLGARKTADSFHGMDPGWVTDPDDFVSKIHK